MTLNRTVTVSRRAAVHELAAQITGEVFTADSPAEGPGLIESVRPELILFDEVFAEHLESFAEAVRKISRAPIVLVTTAGSNLQRSPVESLACDYRCDADDLHGLKEIARRIGTPSQAQPLTEDLDRFFCEDFAASVSIVGRSRATKQTLKMTKLVAESTCNPVLVVGPTGAGKELVARAVHTIRNPNGPFVAVNCAALSASLLESELFGHVKGAFTGAEREKTGLLETAATGTLFLDEISEIPVGLQAKLLRVLQEKNFRKVGGTEDIRVNATIVASSNRNLDKETRAERFRKDLYYRLAVSPIVVAPLSSPGRKEDIPLLAEYFLKTSTICPRKKGKIKSLTKLALEALQKYEWPGNVRELRNVIDRAILFETTDKIGLSSIVLDPTRIDEHSGAPAAAEMEDFSLARAEKELIARALQKTGWQKTRAAALLGITRATLYAKVKQHRIRQHSAEAQAADTPVDEPQPAVS